MLFLKLPGPHALHAALDFQGEVGIAQQQFRKLPHAVEPPFGGDKNLPHHAGPDALGGSECRLVDRACRIHLPRQRHCAQRIVRRHAFRDCDLRRPPHFWIGVAIEKTPRRIRIALAQRPPRRVRDGIQPLVLEFHRQLFQSQLWPDAGHRHQQTRQGKRFFFRLLRVHLLERRQRPIRVQRKPPLHDGRKIRRAKLGVKTREPRIQKLPRLRRHRAQIRHRRSIEPRQHARRARQRIVAFERIEERGMRSLRERWRRRGLRSSRFGRALDFRRDHNCPRGFPRRGRRR